jgi:hypothetical protein
MMQSKLPRLTSRHDNTLKVGYSRFLWGSLVRDVLSSMRLKIAHLPLVELVFKNFALGIVVFLNELFHADLTISRCLFARLQSNTRDLKYITPPTLCFKNGIRTSPI